MRLKNLWSINRKENGLQRKGHVIVYRPKTKATKGPNGIVLKEHIHLPCREKSILIKLLGVPEPYAQTKVQSVGYNRVEDPPSISTGSNKYSVPWEENNLLF